MGSDSYIVHVKTTGVNGLGQQNTPQNFGYYDLDALQRMIIPRQA